MPINKKCSLADLKAVCASYYRLEPKRYLLIEYVMLSGVNDRLEDALALIKWVEGMRVKINLIPFHPYPGSPYVCSTDAQVMSFSKALKQAGLIVLYRKSCGLDIQAACGQLANKN